MLRTAFFALALAVSASLASAATDDELRQQIVGAWGQDATCSTGALGFAADGTFTFSQPGKDAQLGTWAIAGGILTGSMAGETSPDARVDITDAGLTIAEIDGGQTTTLLRCPS